MLAIFFVLLGAQLMFAVLEPAALAAAVPQAPLGGGVADVKAKPSFPHRDRR